jgi:hypothetical protein
MKLLSSRENSELLLIRSLNLRRKLRPRIKPSRLSITRDSLKPSRLRTSRVSFRMPKKNSRRLKN